MDDKYRRDRDGLAQGAQTQDRDGGYAQSGYGYGQSATEGYGARAGQPQAYKGQHRDAWDQGEGSDRAQSWQAARASYGQDSLGGGEGDRASSHGSQAGYGSQGGRFGYSGQGTGQRGNTAGGQDRYSTAGGYGRSSGYGQQAGGQGRDARRNPDGAHHNDDHYKSWRDKQIEQHDREYEEYRQHKQAKFHSEFEQWRQSRQGQSSGQSGQSSTGTAATHEVSGQVVGNGAPGSAGASGGNADLADAAALTGTADNVGGSTGSSSPASSGAGRTHSYGWSGADKK